MRTSIKEHKRLPSLFDIHVLGTWSGSALVSIRSVIAPHKGFEKRPDCSNSCASTTPLPCRSKLAKSWDQRSIISDGTSGSTAFGVGKGSHDVLKNSSLASLARLTPRA